MSRIPDKDLSATERLARHIRHHGPIPTVTVSSAHARGKARDYPYWGAVRYEVRCRKADGLPTYIACEAAGSDRRAEHLAYSDAADIAHHERRMFLGLPPGPLSERECESVLCEAYNHNLLVA